MIPVPSIFPVPNSWNKHHVGKKTAAQLSSFVIQLMDNKFIGNEGTCNTDKRGILDPHMIVPDPKTV
jgi:hypothetical protein